MLNKQKQNYCAVSDVFGIKEGKHNNCKQIDGVLSHLSGILNWNILDFIAVIFLGIKVSRS